MVINNKDMSFGTTLTELMKARRITLSQLTALLGYKSKTSLVRVLKDEASKKSIEKCMRLIHSTGIFDDDDQKQLKMVIEAREMGAERYAAWQTMWALLHKKHHDSWEVSLSDLQPVIDQLLETCAGAKHIKLLLLNCCWPAFVEKLCKTFAPLDPVQSEHHFLLDQNIARTTRSVATVVHEIPYMARLHMTNSAYWIGANTDVAGFLLSDLVCVQAEFEGEFIEQAAIIHPQFGASLFNLSDDQSLYTYLKNTLQHIAPQARDFGCHMPGNPTVEDFIRESEINQELEWNRPLYLVEPDLCMHCLDAQTVLGAFDIQLLAQFLPAGASHEAMMFRFLRSHAQRYRNLFETKKPKHFFVSRRHVEQFAMTGKLAVHFFGMRPFTIEERLIMLENCLHHMQTNPFFHVHFWKNEADVPNDGYACYGGTGFSLFDGHPSATPNGVQIQLLLRDAEIANLFRDFFMTELLPKHMISNNDALKFMRALVTDLRRLLA